MSTIPQIVDAARGFAGTSGMTNPSTQPVWLAVITLLKKSDSSTVTVGAATSTPIWNGSGAPAGVQFRAGLVTPTTTQTLVTNGEPGFSSVVTWGEFRLVNTDGYWNGKVPGQTVDYLDSTAYEWRSVVLYLGVNPDAYGDFQMVDSYRLEGRPQIVHPYVVLQPRGALLDGSRPAYDERYKGFDTAFQTDGSSDIQAGNTDWCIALAEDAYWRFRFKVPANASHNTLWSSRATSSGTAAGWNAHVNASGELVFRIADGATDFVVKDTSVWDDGEWHDVQVWIDRSDNTLNGLVDGAAFSTDADDVSALIAVTTTATAAVFEEATDGGLAAVSGVEIDELYFATGEGIAPSADLRKQHRNGPASARDTGCQYLWHLDEDNGAAVEHAYDVKAGTAVELPKHRCLEGTAATREVDYGNVAVLDMDASTDYTVWCWFRCDSTPVGAIVSKKSTVGGTDAGWCIYATAAQIRLRLADGSTLITRNTAVPIADEVWRCVALVVDRSGVRGTADTAHFMLSDSSGTVWTALGTKDIAALGDMSNAINCLQGETGDAGNNFDGDLGSWGFVDGTALTDAQLTDFVPIHPTQADIPNLAAYYAFDTTDEGTSTIADQVGSADGTKGAGAAWKTRDGTITGSGVWVATLTGSHANGVGGTSKPQTYGKCELVEPVLIDHRGHDHTADGGFADCIVYEWHAGPDACTSVENVSEGGVLMALTTDYKLSTDKTRIFVDVSVTMPDGEVRVTGKGAKFHTGSTYSGRAGLIGEEVGVTNGHLTAGELPTASATDFDATFPYPVAAHIPGGKEKPKTIAEFYRDLFPAPGLATSTNLTGATFHFLRTLRNPDDYTADFTLTDTELAGIPTQLDPHKPVRLVRVGYARQWAPLNNFLDGASAANQKRFGQEYSWAEAASSTVADEDGRDIIIRSPLQKHADAQRWAQHVLTRLADPLIVEAPIARHFWEAFIVRAGRARNDVVSLTSAYAPVVSTATKFLVWGVGYSAPRVSSPWEISLILGRPSS